MAKVTHEEAAKKAVRMKMQRIKTTIERLEGEYQRAAAYLSFLEKQQERSA